MPIKIEKTLTLRTVGADLVVIPLHALHMDKALTLHPTLQETCLYDFPLAYSYYRQELDLKRLKRGDVLFYERLGDSPVLMAIVRGDIRRKFDLHAIVKCLKWIRDNDLHNKHTIAFPGIGCYESDRIDPKIVFRSVKRFLADGSKTVHFVMNY